MEINEIVGKFIDFYKSENSLRKYELYSEDCISVENPTNGIIEEIVGLEKIKLRHHEFYSQFSEIHKKEVSEPLIADHAFSVVITFDVSQNNGVRKLFRELCIFYVKDGKIIKQEFIY